VVVQRIACLYVCYRCCAAAISSSPRCVITITWPQRTPAVVSPTFPHPGRHYQLFLARTMDKKERLTSAAVDDASVGTCNVQLETAAGTVRSSRTTPSTPVHTQTPATPCSDRPSPALVGASENKVTGDGGGCRQRRRRRHRLGVRHSHGRRQ